MVHHRRHACDRLLDGGAVSPACGHLVRNKAAC
jgi:hypothetical protein